MADPSPPSDRIPAQVAPVEMPGLEALLTLAVAVVVVAGLFFGREVLIPITLAILLSFVIAPLVNLLRRVHLGRVPSVLLAVVMALAVILALGGLIGTQIADLASEVPQYQSTIERKIGEVRSFALTRMSGVIGGLGRQLQKAGSGQPIAAPGNPAAEPPAGPKPVPVEVHPANPTPLELTKRILEPVISPLSTTAIVLIFSVFILLQREDLRDRLIRLFGSGDLHRTTLAMNDAARRLSRYFLAQLAVNAAFGAIIGLGLFLIGLPSPLLWGILGMLLRFVPYIGSPLSAVLPLALAAAVDPGWSMLVWTAALYVVVEPITGQVVEPMLYGHSTGLSPFAVVVAATFWTWLWGPIGLLLSTPLTLCLVVLGRHVKRLEFLDVLLGDRPALSPVESFYQRMLAGDPDEALDQAEILLKERSLSSYYDEVALKGLQLAANDSLRGVLSGHQLERVKSAIDAVVSDLDRHDDADPQPPRADAAPTAPPPSERDLPRRPAPEGSAPDQSELPPEWRSEAAVLCLAGRGPLDEAASNMLAQLLRKHGLGARTLPFEAASRERIAAMDRQGVAMVCISYLEISGSPAHLRYLLRRLRVRLPDAKILVGLWPAEDEVLKEDRMRAVIGADCYTSSLHEAVETCLDAARQARVPAPAAVVARVVEDPGAGPAWSGDPIPAAR
ncbi:MAG: AI-2E family transporter [Acidisphaera sp.]|nr:AI-2E family transporter [Acidisphaera sp.]